MSLPRNLAYRFLSSSRRQGEARIAEEAAARRHAGAVVSSLMCQIRALHAPPRTKYDLGIFPFLSLGRPDYAGKARLMVALKRIRRGPHAPLHSFPSCLSHSLVKLDRIKTAAAVRRKIKIASIMPSIRQRAP